MFLYPASIRASFSISLSFTQESCVLRLILLLGLLRIVLLPDRFINSQLIADQFAANGYIVAMPDLFHGDSVKLNRPETFNLMSWLEGHPIERVDPVVDSVLKYMRTRLGCEKIGAVGYCFGVRMTNSTGKMCRFQSLTKYTLPPGKIRGPISEARRRQGRRRIYRASRIR